MIDMWHQKLTNEGVPRGPGMGFHVAPMDWSELLVKFVGVCEVQTLDLPLGYAFVGLS